MTGPDRRALVGGALVGGALVGGALVGGALGQRLAFAAQHAPPYPAARTAPSSLAGPPSTDRC